MEEDHRATAWIEGFAILLAVFISSFITTVNNYQKQKQFAALNDISESRKMVVLWKFQVTMIRNGQQMFVH